MRTERLRAYLFGFLSGGAAFITLDVAMAQQSGSPPDAMISLQQVIAANANNPKQICPAITPLLRASPSAATAVIDSAQSQPSLFEPLCECLSSAQKALSKSDPQGAAIVAKAVAAASPAFQACYAVALAPGDGGAAVGPPSVTGGGTGGGGGAPFSPVGIGTLGGMGGRLVSPN